MSLLSARSTVYDIVRGTTCVCAGQKSGWQAQRSRNRLLASGDRRGRTSSCAVAWALIVVQCVTDERNATSRNEPNGKQKEKQNTWIDYESGGGPKVIATVPGASWFTQDPKRSTKCWRSTASVPDTKKEVQKNPDSMCYDNENCTISKKQKKNCVPPAFTKPAAPWSCVLELQQESHSTVAPKARSVSKSTPVHTMRTVFS